MKEYPKNSSTPKDKGIRLDIVREMTYLNRTNFCSKYRFKTETFRSWENGLHGGLPMKRAKDLVNIFLNEGLILTAEWLMYGTGEEPEKIDLSKIIEFSRIYFKNKKLSKCFKNFEEEERAQQELDFFRLNRPEVISITIEDDGMAPFYEKGDVVAGLKYYEKDIDKLHEKDCIVTILGQEETPILRRIQLGKEKHRYNLVCINLDTQVEKPFLKEVKLISAAPAIWHRKVSLLHK